MVVRCCSKCKEESAFKEHYGSNDKVKCCKCKTNLTFKCKKCQKEFAKKPLIVKHVNEVCYPQEEFKCSKCDFKAVSADRVKKHYKLQHRFVSAECKNCGKKFKNIPYLKLHQKLCEVSPKFQCDHCAFKSKTKRGLSIHIFRKHMEPIVIDKSESLKMSNQRFSRTLTHLQACCLKCKKDQRLYERLKKCIKCNNKLHFKCKTCKKQYTADNENACDHVKAYLEMIKFECQRCGRGAISKVGLSQHKSRCGKSFPCRFCKYVNNVKGRTIIHEKTKHPDQI